MVNITVTESAQVYLGELLGKQEGEVLGIRMFVNQPGTPKAETCIAYCRDGDVNEDDIQVEYNGFKGFFEARSVPFLDEAMVDYAEDKFGGQLTIKAPNSKQPKLGEDSPVEDRVNYYLYNEINPSLASHGGEVSLVEITEDKFAVLKFGGGCQGCGMVDETLKGGVEKTLLDNIPQLAGVKDITDHTVTENAYFK
ncbi:MAG: Fe/S biogenesis protein NfuA [Alphaproteobacteria bacterium]|jgi:Fe/S biogenesis protein NfuA